MRRVALLFSCIAAAWLAPGLATSASACDVYGVVRDADGLVVPGIEIALEQGFTVRRTATDSEGRYRFSAAQAAALRVTVVLADGAHDPAWFQIFHERRGIIVASDSFSSAGEAASCERNFDFANMDERYPEGEFRPQWRPDAIALFQGFSEALSLSERLGVDLGRTPLEINAFYAAASPDSSFWVGTPSYAPDTDRRPFIGVGVNASTRNDRGWPGNREDHEIAHHLLARTLGGAHPRARADTNHGGYWTNPTSTDAWGEGFASFYAVMVAKHVRKTDRPHWLAVDGAVIDLELDYQPWDLGGLEEVAVAGLLLDLEDGPNDYASPASGLSLWGPTRTVSTADATIITGQVRADQGSAAGAVLGLSLLDEGGRVVGRTRTIAVGEAGASTAQFAALVPATVAAVSARLEAFGPADDDPVDLTLVQVWRAIADFTSTKPQSNGRLFDIDDLYAAMKKNFGGNDSDGDGTEDIDQLFIAHGLFADRNGDRVREASEPLGQTGHPATTLTVAGKLVERPALEPRFRMALPPALQASVALPQPGTTVLVLATAADRPAVAYAPRPDRGGRVVLVPPPARPGAPGTLTVLALADDTQPTVVLQLDAVQMLASIEGRADSFLELTARMDPAPAQQPAAREDLRYAFGVFVGGSVTLLFGVALTLIGLARRR